MEATEESGFFDTLGSVFKTQVAGIVDVAGESVRSRIRPTSTDAVQAVPVPAGTRVSAPVQGDGPATTPTLAASLRDNLGLLVAGLVAVIVAGLVLKKLG